MSIAEPTDKSQNQRSTPVDAPVSLFQGSTTVSPGETATLGAVLARIQDGTYQAATATLRRLYTRGETDAYRQGKERSMAFTPCCVLKTRDKDVPWPEKLLGCTGLVHLDMDNLDDPEALKAQLAQHPAVVFAFVSPSGRGLKVGIAATGITDTVSYKHAWTFVVTTLQPMYPAVHINVDPQVKYLNALCFVSHDPTLYVNPDAEAVLVPAPVRAQGRPLPVREDASADYATVMEALSFVDPDDYTRWYDIGAALHASEEPWAQEVWESWSQGSEKYNQKDQDAKWHQFVSGKGITLGTLFYYAKQGGWHPHGRPRSAAEGLSSYIPRDSDDTESPCKTTTKVFSSFKSLTSYPWPILGEEAYYGLAGDYVRTIEPHTESDPAALLAQFLTVFGVICGRQRYFRVGDVRHHGNLFTVIAGKTSRARKGTSYAHIEAQMASADPTWGLQNHIKGCGSGEGLIFAVRDSRTSREAIKEKGKVIAYEEVETDAGVQDKRALFQTGEFSSILKICAREGNTLSEVIRDSWDTGYLRNATKNNPLTATNAHIGIIGHVTVPELQRLLTSTDAANGFANRFIWICAERSKLLPDGGAIETVDFHTLVTRLRAALAFAKQPGQMRRDHAASVAWQAVYDMLSHDSTGLANTLLARAEAQVLRLSMLYALLDQSATIKHAHLNAALALWHYAEASAAYLFGEATGDATADIILQALAKTGTTGCLKGQLIEEVFQRNTPSREIDRALHLLADEGRIAMAKRPPAGGKGRPAEVWFLVGDEVNEKNDVNPNRYLIASNDAVKSMSSFVEDVTEKYEESPEIPVFSSVGELPLEEDIVVPQDTLPYGTPSAHDTLDTHDTPDHPVASGCEVADAAPDALGVELSPCTAVPVTVNGTALADCLPETCLHPQTTTKTMEDGSRLVRCTTCRWQRVITHP